MYTGLKQFQGPVIQQKLIVDPFLALNMCVTVLHPSPAKNNSPRIDKFVNKFCYIFKRQ